MAKTPERWIIVVPWGDHTLENPQPGAHCFGPWETQEDATKFLLAWGKPGSAMLTRGYVSQVINPQDAANQVRSEESFRADIESGKFGL